MPGIGRLTICAGSGTAAGLPVFNLLLTRDACHRLLLGQKDSKRKLHYQMGGFFRLQPNKYSQYQRDDEFVIMIHRLAW